MVGVEPKLAFRRPRACAQGRAAVRPCPALRRPLLATLPARLAHYVGFCDCVTHSAQRLGGCVAVILACQPAAPLVSSPSLLVPAHGFQLPSVFVGLPARPSHPLAAFNRFVATGPSRASEPTRVRRRCPALAAAQLHLMLSRARPTTRSHPHLESGAPQAWPSSNSSSPNIPTPAPCSCCSRAAPCSSWAACPLQCLSRRIPWRAETRPCRMSLCWPRAAGPPSQAQLASVL